MAEPPPAGLAEVVASALDDRLATLRETLAEELTTSSRRAEQEVARLSEEVSGLRNALAEGRAAQDGADALLTTQVTNTLSATGRDIRSSVESALETRAEELRSLSERVLEAVRSALGGVDESSARATAELREGLSHVAAAVEAIGPRLAELATSAERTSTQTDPAQVGGVVGQQVDRVARAVTEILERVEESYAQLREESASGLQSIQRQLEHTASEARQQSVAGVTEVASLTGEAIQAAAASQADTLRSTGQELANLRAQTGELLETVRREAGNVIATFSTDLHELQAALQGFGDRLDGHGDRLDGFGRMLDAMSERRGFRRLVESEQELINEQKEFAESLVNVGQAVVQGTEQMGEEVRAAHRAFQSMLDAIRADTVADIERIQAEMRRSLVGVQEEVGSSLREIRTYIDRIAGPREDIQALRRELQGMAMTVRGEITSMGGSVTEARDAADARFQEFLGELSNRLSDIGRRMGATFAQELDRRFESLLRLVDTRQRELIREALRGREPGREEGDPAGS